MQSEFAQSLADWGMFYALMGGAAATLLGLQFVALSLRLHIFRDSNVADVRDFAAYTFATFLVAIAVAGVALAPHEQSGSFALVLAVIGVGGVAALIWIVRVWMALNQPANNGDRNASKSRAQGGTYLVVLGGAYLGMIAAAFLVWRGHPFALGWLAIVEVWLLGMGTSAAWLLLSHAGIESH